MDTDKHGFSEMIFVVSLPMADPPKGDRFGFPQNVFFIRVHLCASVVNRDLIAAAKFTFCVPVSDFANAFGHITSISRESYVAGDVVLVPDGPKPLVLASSLVPEFLDRTGIVSLHVRRRKFDQAGPVDVVAAGEIYGFSVAGSTGSQKNDD
jgi:hypothetical protein